jgi:hypothetical protein
VRVRHTPPRINRTTKIIGVALPTIALVGAFAVYQLQHTSQGAGNTASYQQHTPAAGAVAPGAAGPALTSKPADSHEAGSSKLSSTAKSLQSAKPSVRPSSSSNSKAPAATSAGAASTATTAYAANLDYATGGYGTYSSAALSDPHIGGVVINMNWDEVEKTRAHYNWTPLNNELAAWSKAGKRVSICVRFANEVGGGTTDSMLPGWVRASIPTFTDTIQDSLIPDYFNATFKSDWKAFIGAFGAHLKASRYVSAISYVRIATGLGGESFPVMPTSYSADMPKLRAWGYTPAAWEAWQKGMLGYYHWVLPSTVHDIYSIVKLDTDPKTGNPIELDVAKWATRDGRIGIGQESIPPGSYGGGAGYADINTICDWVHAHHPLVYIQFQTGGPLTSASAESGIISDAEAHWARSIEWYESGITNAAYQPGFSAFQKWVNSTFGT